MKKFIIQPMKVSVRYNSVNHIVETPADITLNGFQDLIRSQLSIPDGSLKMVMKGKNLVDLDSPLSVLGVEDGSKILLVVSEVLPDKAPPPVRRIRQPFFPPTQEFLNSPPHSPIIAKGPPQGVEKPFKGQYTSLPKTPFIVYNTEGVVSMLSIEYDAIWIQSDDGKNERIFFSDIHLVFVQDIPKYEEKYVAIAFHTSIGKRWFYFIPHQYSHIIKTIVK